MEKVYADYYGDACHLPFRDNSLDYVITSHVLEHVANPVAALVEWYRVLRPGGIIYLLVPDRRYIWDHGRPLTTVAHMLDDHRRGTTACDATHIDEFVFGADWAMYSPSTPPSEVPERRTLLAEGMHHAVREGRDINIHFHTFEPTNVIALLDTVRQWPATRFAWEIVDQAERFPAENPLGFLAVVRVKKNWRDRLASWCVRPGVMRDRKNALRPDAKPFAEWTENGATEVGRQIAACIDAPIAAASVAENFTVRGWIRLENQADIVSVEAWVGAELIGKTETFYDRPDVVAALALPAGTRTGFDIPATLRSSTEIFDLRVYARLKNDSLVQVGIRALRSRPD